MLRILFTVSCLCCLFLTPNAELQTFPNESGQVNSKPLFGNPIDPPFTLAGTFGELRPDHFHTGIDFSTKEREGLPVYAAADGYVSRIKVAADGFGKAIYITHPNHYVTVYAHLKKYAKEIEKYVRKNQYEKESFEIELFPQANEIVVKKGEVIAYSGNTGNSGGPHLHFEIRDEKTEEPMNPMLFGYIIPDNVKPEINAVRIYPVAGQGRVNNSSEAKSFNVVEAKDGTLSVKDEINASGMIGFEFKVIDHQNGSDDNLGIYSLELKIDGKQVFGYKYDRLNFSDQRYANAHLDYAASYDGLGVYERGFKLTGDKLKIYDAATGDGHYNFSKEGTHKIEVTVKDFNGNTQRLQFTVHCLQFTNNIKPQTLIPRDKDFTINEPDVEIVIPSNALYEDYAFVHKKLSSRKEYYSEIFEIGDPHVPLHLSMSVGIKPTSFPESLLKRAVIVSFDKNGKEQYEGGTWEKGFFTTKTKHFGTFAVTVDTVAPVIALHSSPKKKNETLTIKITDNLSGIKTYRATIDDKWNLMEYDRKKNLLIGDLTVLTRRKTHQLKLTVSDAVGNATTFNKSFFY